MRLTAAYFATALLLASCGDVPPVEISPASSVEAVGVLRVVCNEHLTVVLTPRVRARTDGIHVVFINRAGTDEFYMRSDDDPDENHGGRLPERITKDVSSHAPGRMRVACYERSNSPAYDGDDPRFAEFEIVDPEGLWIPFKVACQDPETIDGTEPDGTEMIVPGARSVDDVERYLRERFDLPREAVRARPGYPETGWKGNPFVLRHKGETIAYFHAFVDDGKWRLALAEVCT